MSLHAYQEYKKSGVAWIENIPKHWTAKRLKNILKQKITDGPHSTPIFTSEGVPFLSVDGIQNGELIFESCRYISPADHAEFKRKALPQKNDLLMGKAASTGKIARVKVDFEFSIWSPLALIRIDKNFSAPEFVEYALKSPMTQAEIDTFCTANTQKNISMDDIPRLSIFHPPLKEQKAIALFLDHQTTKIETLISEQKKLIELLKEKRQAVISHAVTKGLDPKAKMKDSGVVWLGDIPDHWGVRAIKHIVSTPVTDGPHETPEFFDDGVPFVSAEAVSSGEIDFSKIRGYISLESHKQYSLKYLPKKGDIFMIKSGATTGVTAIVETDQEFNIWSPLAVIRCNADSNPYYVLNFMRSLNFQEAVALNWNFGTQQNIGMGVIENLFCPVPSQQEQKAIAEYLTSFTKQFNTLISEANNAIELLKERRSALISAAVTGQIDVRNYQPKEAA